jgi:hypothetical protein
LVDSVESLVSITAMSLSYAAEAATAVVVAPDDGHEDARNMLSCI